MGEWRRLLDRSALLTGSWPAANRPAAELDAADIYGLGDLRDAVTPTVGHHADDKLAIRCDRIRTNLPPEHVSDYEVVRTGDHLSDHRPVRAVLTFGL